MKKALFRNRWWCRPCQLPDCQVDPFQLDPLQVPTAPAVFMVEPGPMRLTDIAPGPGPLIDAPKLGPCPIDAPKLGPCPPPCCPPILASAAPAPRPRADAAASAISVLRNIVSLLALDYIAS